MTDTERTLPRSFVPPLVHRAFAYELGMWRSLYRWVLRRPVVSADAKAFGYAATVTPVLLAFIGVSAVEIPILHLLLPWEGVRRVCDALGAYGLFWMMGLLASVRVHPHAIGDAGLRLRNGTAIDITVAWGAIATVQSRHRSLSKRRAVQFEQTPSGLVAHLVVMNQTNVDIKLREPIALPDRSDEPIIELRCYVDDPRAFVIESREHLAPRG